VSAIVSEEAIGAMAVNSFIVLGVVVEVVA
jgi:hypothetical protein